MSVPGLKATRYVLITFVSSTANPGIRGRTGRKNVPGLSWDERDLNPLQPHGTPESFITVRVAVTREEQPRNRDNGAVGENGATFRERKMEK